MTACDGALYRVLITNVHPDLTPDLLRRTFKDICEEDPTRVEFFRLRDETMLTAVAMFTRKESQQSSVLLDGVVVGKKSGCPIFVILDDSPETFMSILPQNSATFVCSSPPSTFSSVLSPSRTTNTLQHPSHPVPLQIGSPASAKLTPATPPITSKPLETPVQPTPKQALSQATPKRAPASLTTNQTPSVTTTTPTPTPTPTSTLTSSIFSLNQSYIPPSMLSTLQTNSTAPPPNFTNSGSTTTTPRQTLTKNEELTSLKNSLVFDLVASTDHSVINKIFGPDVNNSTIASTFNNQEKAEVVNKLITAYKPEIVSHPIPIHLMKPIADHPSTTSNAATSTEILLPTESTTSTQTAAPTGAPEQAPATAVDSTKTSEQLSTAPSVPTSAKNIWNWATTVFHEFIQENLEDYELSQWGVFFFERTKARLPVKLSIEQQRQYLRPLIGRIDHDFHSRGQGKEQTYQLYWALFDILLCRMYGENTALKPEAGETPTGEEGVDEIECKKIMTEIGKIPHLVQANMRIYLLEQSLNSSSIETQPRQPPSNTDVAPTTASIDGNATTTTSTDGNTTTPTISMPSLASLPSTNELSSQYESNNVIDVLFIDHDNLIEEEVKKAVEKELLSRYFQSIIDGKRPTPTAIVDMKSTLDQISSKSAANIELLRTRQGLKTQTAFAFDVSVPLGLVQEHCSNLIPLINHTQSTNNNCLIM